MLVQQMKKYEISLISVHAVCVEGKKNTIRMDFVTANELVFKQSNHGYEFGVVKVNV